MPYDPNNPQAMLAALQGQQLPPRAMQALMGGVPVLQGGNVLPSPDPGPGAASAVPGVNLGEMRQNLGALASRAGNVGTPMDWALQLGGGPGTGGAMAMAAAPRMAELRSSIRAAMEADPRLRRGWANQGIMNDLAELMGKNAWNTDQISRVLSGHRHYLGPIDPQAAAQRLKDLAR